MSTGQAAGVAADIAVREGVRPRDIDGRRVRALLIEEGVELDQPCDGYWKEQREKEGKPVVGFGDIVWIVPEK